jgi:hypothetical protein
MKQKRIFALLLAAIMLAGLFSACGNPTQGEEDSGEDSAQQDIIDPETVVATAADGDITWGQVCYWMYYQMSDYYNQYGTTPNLSVEISEGYTYGDYMLETAIDQMVRYRAIEKYAEENNIALVEADTAGVDDYIQKMIDQYGSEEAYEQAVADMNATPEDIRTIQELNFLNQRVFKTIYGPEGDKLSDEALASFAETNGFVMAKIILFLKIDETGEALDEETVAKAKTAAEDAAAQLDAWTEASSAYATKEELFTALMNELSEDTELENFPDGYIVGPDDMYEDIYNAILDLEVGQISGVVDTDTCYAIIQRIPLNYDATPYCYKSYAAYGYSYSFRQLAASSMYDEQVAGWVEDAQLEKKPVLATIDVAAYFS